MTVGNRYLPAAGLVLAIGLVAMIGGCDRQPAAGNAPAAPAISPVDAAARANVVPVDTATSQEAPGLDGVWRVAGVAVAADAPSAFATDDPAMMGSEITISRAALAWTRKTSSDFTSDDVCNGPTMEVVSADPAPAEFAAALARFAADEKAGSVLHWACTKGGSWGPDADDGARMQRIGDNRLIMGWYDGVVLLLHRAGGAR